MTHDWSHLDEAVCEVIANTDGGSSLTASETMVVGAASRQAVLSALTPSDLAAMIAEKCPGWVAVHQDANDAQCRAIMRLWLLSDQEPVGGDFRLAEGYWKKFVAVAPKLGEGN